MSDLRLYTPDECGRDGYPLAWHKSIKHAVRETTLTEETIARLEELLNLEVLT